MYNLIKIIDINSLVICGGGTKGYLIFGILKLLYEKNILKKIKYFYGTSIGGVFITCLVMGWSINEIYNLIINFPLEKLINYNIKKFLDNNGLISKNKYETLLKKILKYKGFDENITLYDLFKISNLELNLFTYSIKYNKTKCLNYLNTPNLKVWEALFMTTSVPFLFPPYHYDNDLFIDGGILDNYPINWINIKNKNKFIGIYVKPDLLDYYYIFSIFNNKNIIAYMKYIINIFHILILKNNICLDNTFTLNYDSVKYKSHFLDFSLDIDFKKNMINDGYEQAIFQYNDIIEKLFISQVSNLKQIILEKSLIFPEQLDLVRNI